MAEGSLQGERSFRGQVIHLHQSVVNHDKTLKYIPLWKGMLFCTEEACTSTLWFVRGNESGGYI